MERMEIYQVVDFGCADFGLLIADCGLTDCGLQIADCGFSEVRWLLPWSVV